MSYLFGDSDLAAQRLGLVASTFRASSEELLRETLGLVEIELAIDLGCGPGYSTQMISEVLKPKQMLGLDNSEQFIKLASDQAFENIEFAVHDFTVTPFPKSPADLLYSRFELTHFEDWKNLIASWGSQLKANGLLILEEVEWIKTGEPAFTVYLGMLESLMHHQGLDLYIGKRVDDVQEPEGLKKVETRVHRVGVPPSKAAMMFLMNIWSWRQQPFIQENYPVDFIEQIEMSLQELTEDPLGLLDEEPAVFDLSPDSAIEWGIRQIAFQRVAE